MKNIEDFLRQAEQWEARVRAMGAEAERRLPPDRTTQMREMDPPLVTPAQMRAGMAPTVHIPTVHIPDTPHADPGTPGFTMPSHTGMATPMARTGLLRSGATPTPRAVTVRPETERNDDFTSSMRSVMDTVKRVANVTGSDALKQHADQLESSMRGDDPSPTRNAAAYAGYPGGIDGDGPLARAHQEVLAEQFRREAMDREVAAEQFRRDAIAADDDRRTQAYIDSKKEPGKEVKSLRERLRSITDSVAKLRGGGGPEGRWGRRGYDDGDQETEYAISDDEAPREVRRVDREVQARMSRASRREGFTSANTVRIDPQPTHYDGVRSAPGSRIGSRRGSYEDLGRAAAQNAARNGGGRSRRGSVEGGWWSRPASRDGRGPPVGSEHGGDYVDQGVGDWNVRDDVYGAENMDPNIHQSRDPTEPIVNKESLAAAMAAALAVAESMKPAPPPPPPRMTDEERVALTAENTRLRETIKRLRSELGVANRLVMGYHAQLMTGGSSAPKFGTQPAFGQDSARAPSFKHRAPHAPFTRPNDPPPNAWNDTQSKNGSYVGGNGDGGAKSAWRAEQKRRSAELETLQAERAVAEEAERHDTYVALDANDALRDEIGELREMMREVMRRQQTPKGLRPKPPVHPSSPRRYNPYHSPQPRYNPPEHFQGLYDETRGDEAGDKVTHGVRDPSPEPPDMMDAEGTSTPAPPFSRFS